MGKGANDSAKDYLGSFTKSFKTIDLPNLGKKYQGKVRDFT